jgi:hypothetical protein
MSASTNSIFAPFAEAIRDGHRIAYNLPAKPAPEPAKAPAYTDEQASTTNPALAAWYDRPGCYSGD